MKKRTYLPLPQGRKAVFQKINSLSSSQKTILLCWLTDVILAAKKNPKILQATVEDEAANKSTGLQVLPKYHENWATGVLKNAFGPNPRVHEVKSLVDAALRKLPGKLTCFADVEGSHYNPISTGTLLNLFPYAQLDLSLNPSHPQARTLQDVTFAIFAHNTIRVSFSIQYPRDRSSWTYIGGQEEILPLLPGAQEFLDQLESRPTEHPFKAIGRIFQEMVNHTGNPPHEFHEWRIRELEAQSRIHQESLYELLEKEIRASSLYLPHPPCPDKETKEAFGNQPEVPSCRQEELASLLAEVLCQPLSSSTADLLIASLKSSKQMQKLHKKFEDFLQSGHRGPNESRKNYDGKILKEACAFAVKENIQVALTVPNPDKPGLSLARLHQAKFFPKRGIVRINKKSLPIQEIREFYLTA